MNARQLKRWRELMQSRRRPKPKRKRSKKSKSELQKDKSPVKVERPSDIQGEGYGSKHKWFKGITSLKPIRHQHKYTAYVCLKCNVMFYHYFELTPDVFEFMKQNGVIEECISKRNLEC